ncbi:glycosyltransferase family A protein [Cobetia sp. QF-1]|uniref:glycosyltransferase family 2 protein n=1 Tax=Cobetia sp. QF-1 TaxID=1969833 RepID=UPI001595172C|nr:glycosyltransferase family A protein [Cobetia sp. QF-1]
MTPINHYLEVGEPLGWRPCPDFDPVWYRQQYPDVVSHNLSPLLHFISYGIKEGRFPCKLISPSLDTALWARQDQKSGLLKSLRTLVACDSVLESSYASFALARWYAWQGDWHCAADYLAERVSGKRLMPSHNGPDLLLIESLARSDQLSEAWRSLGKLQRAAPGWYDVRLAAANLLAWQAAKTPSRESVSDSVFDHKSRLAWINGIWLSSGLDGVELADTTVPLSLDNLASGSSPLSKTDNPLLTIIMPAYNATNTISTALTSLIQQCGVNLEVIVVDDASTDNTSHVVEQFSQRDSRIRLLRQPYNRGAYAARNVGLREARGQFITIHDSDDWSHPDKLACQVDALQTHPEWQACCTDWVRCSQNLIFSRWRIEEGWVYRNVSSLMFRRRVFELLGYWDYVRAEADTEYYYRIQAAFGPNVIGEVLRGVPLTLGRSVADSLTSVRATHLVTQYSGVRADYRSASQRWHRENAGRPAQLYLPYEPDGRAFSVPKELLP